VLIEYSFSDECFSLEAIEGLGGRAAVFLPEMWPYLLAQVQPDEALASRVRCRAQISVPELQEAIQAPSSSAGPPENSPLRELRLRDTQLKRTPFSENRIASPRGSPFVASTMQLISFSFRFIDSKPSFHRNQRTQQMAQWLIENYFTHWNLSVVFLSNE